MSELPVTLTIAGSDSGGGAGIQADLKTFQAFGCFGTSALTAITAQNTRGVSGVQGLDPDIVAGQIRAVLEDFPVGAAKTGMLFSVEIIQAVRSALENSRVPVVVDPVMVATSGDRLLQAEAERALIDFLSEATVITPNLPEAGVILGRELRSLADMREGARELHERTGAAVLLKGGHRLQDSEQTGQAIDVFYDVDGRLFEEARPVLDARNTHGTGCTLSAAIAAGLAHGRSLRDAVREARDYLHGAIEHAPNLGSGSGPLNHMWRG